ncbi:MHO_1590 family protein [Mycoplasma sp. 1654_15]|uniref:MHO_1590 family protein n=1 Tax=Mycoplasma sp. 1654_15 TaxID=2725994 RepID=UPI0014492DEC|nr:hypothetical protein [Mycoplasma sp. 1654_15]QJB71387.1 hypothetical protein HF996_02820 [Mycoplasma sp. 1654_15]
MKIKLKLNKKILFISLGVITSLAIIASLTTFFVIKNKQKTEIKSDDDTLFSNSKLEAKDIFPIIYASDYYDLIEIENGHAKIGEKLVAAFVKDIISKITISYGDIKFNYKIKTDQEIFIEFVWFHQDEEVSQNYHFKLKKDNI